MNYQTSFIYLPEVIFNRISLDLSITRGFRGKVKYFLGDLVERGLRRNQLFKFYRISASSLKRLYGNNYYRRVITYCVSFAYITVDRSYEPGRYSKGYRLCENCFKAHLKLYEVTRKPGQRDDSRDNLNLQPYLALVSFDAGAESTLNKHLRRFRRHDRIAAWKYAFNSIRYKRFWLTTDIKTGRVFSNVTNLPKVLRAHL